MSHSITPICPVCKFDREWEECKYCGGEGVDGHDCGEDTACACLEDNLICDTCDGAGGCWYGCKCNFL